MNSSAGILHQRARVDRLDPVALLKLSARGLRLMLATWQARARQRRQLLELDERLLADVGISRSAALATGRRPFWRD